ncbi:hypothetical protein DPMN_005769 [Dreissena polymorpha]|uniref:Uncharacterized protein n=1 Tax=Dreissena polymorpha TaxID=45954 RepID=A0A9D4MQ98_DREPO|nr:hypothetical protein DPMN_005769 [Dreissena polymorpha]
MVRQVLMVLSGWRYVQVHHCSQQSHFLIVVTTNEDGSGQNNVTRWFLPYNWLTRPLLH